MAGKMPKKNAPINESAERRRKRLEREQHVAAFEAMVSRRPLKPPPGRPAARLATAGELALAADRRLGIVAETGRVLDPVDE